MDFCLWRLACLFRFQRLGRLATTSTLVTPLRNSATTLFVDFEDASAECLMLSRMRYTASLAGLDLTGMRGELGNLLVDKV